MNSFRFDRLSRMFYFLIMICSFLLFPDYVFAEESNGWVEINEYRYYYQDGVMLQACLREIEGTVYYFLEDGRMLDCNDEASLTDENGSVYVELLK